LPVVDGLQADWIEQKKLYELAGWVAFKLMSKINNCQACVSYLCSDVAVLPQSSLTSCKSYGGLKHPTKELSAAIEDAEQFFRNHDVFGASIENLVQSCKSESTLKLGNCNSHALYEMAITQYYKLRVHIRASFLTEQMKLQK